jgi:hypothetical protein
VLFKNGLRPCGPHVQSGHEPSQPAGQGTLHGLKTTAEVPPFFYL